MIHLLVAGDDLDRDAVEIEGDDYRHLFRARRLKVGDRVRLVDGRGGARWSVVGGVEAERARLDLEGPAPTFEPARRLTLLVSVVRPERAVWLVEKATELGVRKLQWFVSERTSRAFTARALDRQRRVAKSALEQSGGAWLPRIGAPVPLEEAGDLAGATVLHPSAGTARSAVSAARTLVIGPEGGFSEAEIAWFTDRGATLAGLGPRVLRTETAAVAAVAVALCGS
ncbi:MAG: RsmE family RNA methyltransferase [Acidobacteria bacterium]|nr:RsmE family RNA methyltransferase [Acidobacteriota bacterium]